jgi:crossover junction endodeoxyribonuclease RuvC
MVFIGIDPGVGGGIAMVDEHGNVLRAERMPATERDVFDLLYAATCAYEHVLRATLEFVRSSPQMGVKSAFTFGCGYGGLRMALCATGISYTEVTPSKWQGAMQCRSKGDKNVTKRRAQELFPTVKVTHAVADALLLAEFCRRVERGRP